MCNDLRGNVGQLSAHGQMWIYIFMSMAPRNIGDLSFTLRRWRLSLAAINISNGGASLLFHSRGTYLFHLMSAVMGSCADVISLDSHWLDASLRYLFRMGRKGLVRIIHDEFNFVSNRFRFLLYENCPLHDSELTPT